MRFGFVGGAYTARSSIVADEECINLRSETLETQGGIVPQKAYGAASGQPLRALFGTPGLAPFATLPQTPVRGLYFTGNQLFAVGGGEIYQVSSVGNPTPLGAVAVDPKPASMAFNSVQLLVVSGRRAYCLTLASNQLTEVTSQLAGVPVQCEEADTYFIVNFENSNKFQLSQLLDGTTWPGQLVSEVSTFPENIVSMIMNHDEIWVFGPKRTQVYYDSGSVEAFDPVEGALIEKGCAATFAPCRVDNSVFWIDQDERGGRFAQRSNGYTPTRVSTKAVEYDLSLYTAGQIASLVSYSFQEAGHIYWVLYIPNSSFSWVYDVTEGMWFKWAKWTGNAFASHWGWCHAYAWGMHLVGDWNSGNIYQVSNSFWDDSGYPIRRVRRAPTVIDEMNWITHAELTIDIDTGVQPSQAGGYGVGGYGGNGYGSPVQLLDAEGNPRAPRVMLRWSDDRGRTWSNEHTVSLGNVGQYKTRAIFRRLGRSRYRVYELSISDPIPVAINDAYLRTA